MAGGGITMSETMARDYKAEAEKLFDRCRKLEHEYDKLLADHHAMETEFVRMRAQLDMVYLIFGGK